MSFTRLHAQACALPKKYWRATLDAVPEDAHYLPVIRRYIEKLDTMIKTGKGLLLWGPNRHGKTSLAAVILKQCAVTRHSCYFLRAADFVDAHFHRKTIGWDDDMLIVDMARKVDLLVLDDLGKEVVSKSGSIEAMIDNLLRARDSELRSTIITTNLSIEDQKATYKESLCSLLRESCLPMMIDVKDYTDLHSTWLKSQLVE